MGSVGIVWLSHSNRAGRGGRGRAPRKTSAPAPFPSRYHRAWKVRRGGFSERVQEREQLPLLVARERLVLQPDARGLAAVAADRILDGERQAVVHELRTRCAGPTAARGAHLFAVRWSTPGSAGLRVRSSWPFSWLPSTGAVPAAVN